MGYLQTAFPMVGAVFLVDRLMLRNRIEPTTVGNLNRLAIVGESGMGALSYRPEISLETESSALKLDQIAEECERRC